MQRIAGKAVEDELQCIKALPLYKGKTVYSTTHKTAINRPMDHTGETKHTFHAR